MVSTGEDDDERDYDGKRPGGPMNGLASKKRRKQSKPIRLGNDSIGGERSNNVAEEGGGEPMEKNQHPQGYLKGTLARLHCLCSEGCTCYPPFLS